MNFEFIVKINDEAIAGFSDPDTAYCYCLSYRRRQHGIKLAFIEWKDQYENMFMGGLLR